jgi:hypothetical protein
MRYVPGRRRIVNGRGLWITAWKADSERPLTTRLTSISFTDPSTGIPPEKSSEVLIRNSALVGARAPDGAASIPAASATVSRQAPERVLDRVA